MPKERELDEENKALAALLARLNIDIDDLENDNDDDEEDDENEDDWIDEDCIDIADDHHDDEDDYKPVGHERFGWIVRSEEEKAHGQEQMAYIEQHPKGSTARQIAILMNHCGLTGLDPKYLGGNHPDRVMDNRKKDVNDPLFDRTLIEGLPPLEIRPRLSTIVCPKTNRKKMREAHKARAYKEEHGLTMKQTAAALGYKLHNLCKLTMLTNLPEEVQDYIRKGRMSLGHGRAIAYMRDPAPIARLIIARNLSVRQAETLARRLRYINPDGTLTKETAIPFTYAAEDMMRLALGMKVEFADRGGRGKISITYKSPEEAQYVCDLLAKPYYGAGVDTSPS